LKTVDQSRYHREVKNCNILSDFEGIGFVGKVKWPKSWVIALAGAGVIGIAAGTFAVVKQSTPRFDLNKFTVPVKTEPLTLRISATGSVTPYQSVNLSPKNAGVLTKLLVQQGDRVEKGQIVAYMDQQELKGQLLQAQAGISQAQANLDRLRNGNRPEETAQAKARLGQSQQQLQSLQNGNRPEEIAQARAQLTAAQARLDLAKSKQVQYTQLKNSGAIALEKYNEIMSEAKTAQADFGVAQQKLELLQKGTRNEEIQKAKASVSEAQSAYNLSVKGSREEDIRDAEAKVASAVGQMDVIQSRLSDTIIRSPFTGIVTQKYATEGAFVTPTTSASSTSSATSTSIVAVAQNLEILAKVAEVDIGQIRLGQSVEINVDAYPDQVFKGRVRLVSPEAVVDQNVTTFQVRVAMVTGQTKLLSGMNADLTFLGKTIDDALVIPTVAIATQKGKTGVYIPAKDNKPKFQKITIGTSVKKQTQVLDGIKSGQRVFIDYPKGLEPTNPDDPKK
jgi:HlyD family secretion protein